MSINSDIQDQAYQFFIEEAPELLQVIEAGLLKLRQEHSTAQVHELMRAAHSIKGGAASVGLEEIKILSHRLEDIFKALYSQDVEIDTDLESLLLQAYDCLRLPLGEQIAKGKFDGENALEIAEPIFANIEDRLGDALEQADNYIPSSADLGIDVVSSIFEVDVAEGLERLQSVLNQPQNYEVAGELKAQAEVFAGFGELLNLPGFQAIANTAISALNANPGKALEITSLALEDFTTARSQVMAGDRTQGGTASANLVALTQAITSDTSQDPEFNEEEPFVVDEAMGFAEDIFADFAAILEPVEEKSAPVAEEMEEVVASFDSVPESEHLFADFAPVEDKEEEVIASNPSIAEPPKIKSSEVYREESLEESVAQIEHSFDSLPPLEDIPIPTVQPAQVVEARGFAGKESEIPEVSPPKAEQKVTNNKNKTPKRKARSTPNLSVRVDLSRLERMNNLLGELSINRNSVALQNEQLQEAVRELSNRFERFQTLVERLQELSDQMLVKPELYQEPGQETEQSEIAATNVVPLLSSFDTLEMDHYSAMDSLLQGFFEEVMQLEEAVGDIELFSKQSNKQLEQQRQSIIQLRDELMWARMLPLGEILNRFPRTLRDLSAKYHKPVKLKLSGTGVLVDKAMLEKLYDPLLHLLRNAFDHGIESPQERQEQGKSAEGVIEIKAYHKGNQTIIEIKDDGKGLDFKRIRQRLLANQVLSASQLEGISNERLLDLIFEPGFSTATEVNELSGRGVGLDVVRSQIKELKGTVTVNSVPGKGTLFTLHLPLTLTLAKLLVGLTGSTAVAIPSDSIEEIIIPKAAQVQKSGTQQFLHWRGHMVPTYRLASLLKYSYPLPKVAPGKAFTAISAPQDWALPLLVLRQEQNFLALEIDRLVTEQELVIKPFGTAIPAPNYTYGCTILGDGTLVPVIDGIALLGYINDLSTDVGTLPRETESTNGTNGSSSVLKTDDHEETQSATTVLAVDDSAALRRTLVLTLEKAGYRVLQARNGQEALEQLQQGSKVDLVICDIEMPIMNGFEFLGQRRRYPALTKIPVAMLTSRSNDKHRRLAMQLGADAYFSKPYIEQEFLDALQYILSQSLSVS